jgi:hypothetical protein
MPSLFSSRSENVSQEAPFLEWRGSDELRIGDIRFRLSFDTDQLKRGLPDKDCYLLGKPRHMVEKALEIQAERRISRVFEMGILRGGSVVLYDIIFRPERIVAIDHDPNPVDELENYIRNHRKSEIVKPYYGVSQDDREKMEKLLSLQFPSRDIDLIIDDASHLYAQTREAFNICFPYVAPGGLYVIEDWAWAHWSGDYWQKENAFFKDKPALSNLLIELFMLSASRPDLASELRVDHNKVTVRKGDGKLPAGQFDIADHYLLRGQKFAPFL